MPKSLIQPLSTSTPPIQNRPQRLTRKCTTSWNKGDLEGTFPPDSGKHRAASETRGRMRKASRGGLHF